MQNFPDILKKIYMTIPTHNSNINELKIIWKNYISSLEFEFPEVSIRHSKNTVCLGELSPGCLFCKNGEWDCIFITPSCNLNCDFCISPFTPLMNLPISSYGRNMEEIIKNYKTVRIKGVSFSGGEPFCKFSKIVTHLNYLKKKLSNIYYWIYTNGTLVNKEHIDILSDMGINEIRYNTAATGYNDKKILAIIEYSAKKMQNVTVEIPLLLKDKKVLLQSISDYENAGVKYLNMHELMKENNTRSEHLKNENFKKIIFKDGHITEISMDSKVVIKEIIKKIIDSKHKINLNFCSVMNKQRQIRKRRNNMIKLLKEPYEKIVDEEYLETIFIYKDKDTYQYIHPDDWKSKQTNYKNHTSIALRKIPPLSVFNTGCYIKAQKM